MRIQDRNGQPRRLAASAPRPTKGAETPLAKKSGRVRDDSSALTPALDGRVPGPLDRDDRQDASSFEGTGLMPEGMDEARARVIIARMDEIIDLEVDARAHNGRITDSSYDAAILAAVEKMQVAGITPEDWANALVATGKQKPRESRCGTTGSSRHAR